MRHRVKQKKLNMQKDHRRSVLRSLATSIILFEAVETTAARAKMVQPLVESLITKAKTQDQVTAIRSIKAVAFDENVGRKVMEVLKDRYATRQGGYTRIIKLGNRDGDAAEMVQISLVE